MKVVSHLLLASLPIFFTLNHASAEPTHFLCEERDLITMLAFSTEEYHIAICKEFGDAYHYAGQSRQDSTQKIFLPIVERNNPYTGANPWILKARNGQYTYQVAQFNPFETNSSVSISVFRNGQRIYHRITDSYISSDE